MDSRVAWDALRERFARIEPEFLRGLNELVGRFDISDRANRFIVGGVVEYLIAACFFALDIFVLPRGANQNAFDLDSLIGELRTRFSIKSTFSDRANDLRLMNRLSAGRGWAWREPTIFVIQRLGLVFVDPAVHLDLVAEVRDTGDAFALPVRSVREHAARNSDCLIACNVPVNPRTGSESGARALFKEIFDHPAYPTISGLLKRAQLNVEGAPIMDYIDEINQRRHRGELNERQAQELINALIARLREGER